MGNKCLVSYLMLPVLIILLSIPALADYFEYVGSVQSDAGTHYGMMAFSGNLVALGDANEQGNGINFVDVTDPYQMHSVGFDTMSHAIYPFDWVGNFIYMSASWDGFYIYKVENPNSIVQDAHLALTDFPIDGVAVRGSIAYVGADFNGHGVALYCINVADSYNPSVVWSCDTLDCGEILLGRNLLYSYSWCNEIRIIDITFPTLPRQISRVSCPLIDAMDIDESRDLMYVTCFNYGLLIYNISNPASPGLLSTLQMPNNAQCCDVCHSKVYHQMVFVSGHENGLWAVDTTDPYNPIATASYFPQDGWSRFIRSRGNFVFLTTSDSLIALRFNDDLGIDNPNSGLPADFSLQQNYPNPFNAKTRISYTLPCSQNVRLDIYDPTGRRVSTLFDSYQKAGQYDALWDAAGCPSGLYFGTLTSETNTQTIKIILLK
jgi:hypothetical protein